MGKAVKKVKSKKEVETSGDKPMEDQVESSDMQVDSYTV
jgi:hypothetical protein